MQMLPRSYQRESEQKLIDLLVYLKYYLSKEDYNIFVNEIKSMLIGLQTEVQAIAFDNIRASMGIKDITHLDILLSVSKNVEYNKF